MQIPKDYPIAVAVALAMNLHCFTSGFAVGAARKKIFNKDFMEKQFGLQHKKQLGQQIKPGGYPDTGNGVYSQKLSYKDWYRFNVLQRIHLNYVQNICLATTATLAAGLYQPKSAAYAGIAYIVGRTLYQIFYKRQGGALNKLRMMGALTCLLGILANSIIFATNFYKGLGK